MYRVLPLLVSLVAATAHAQTPSEESLDDLEAPSAAPGALRGTGYTFDGVAPTKLTRREFAMEFNFRGRMVSIPRGVLDSWYFDDSDENWAYIEGRPRVWGYGLGMELVVKSKTANGIFYAEFVDSEMKAGYWDDVEEPPDHLDGDFLSPSPGVGLVAVGANYAYEAHIIETSDTMGRFGLSFLVGGGLGLGVLTGVIDRWGPDDDGNPSYKRYLDGVEPDSDKQLPRVFPMVDLNTGLRFNFGDRVVVRVEGGLHTMLYYGTTAGVMF